MKTMRTDDGGPDNRTYLHEGVALSCKSQSTGSNLAKTTEELKPNYGPVYAGAIYPDMAKLFQKHGYALAVHGSVARDFDLIAVPWAKNVSGVDQVFNDIESNFAVTLNREDYAYRNHGRRAWIMTFGFGACAVDISFIPNELK